MGRFIIPLQQAPPRRRHLRSPTSPSHFAFRIHAQQRCSTPPAAAAWLISHQALHFSSKRPISHVAQQCFTSDIVNLPRLHRGDALNKVVHFLMLRRLMPGSSGVPSKKDESLLKTCTNLPHSRTQSSWWRRFKQPPWAALYKSISSRTNQLEG